MNFPNNNILDIIISLTLIYAMLSILVSILLEWLNQIWNARATLLKNSIFQLLKDPLNLDYGLLFYGHFMIDGLKSLANKPPQYISAGMFSEVLIDIIASQAKNAQNLVENEANGGKPLGTILDQFEKGLDNMNPSPFRDLLLSFWEKADKDYEKLKKLISIWFDDYMERVSGLYKNNQKWKFILIGFIVAISLNVDSLHLVKILSLDDTLRSNLVATSENIADQYKTMADSARKTSSKLIQMVETSIPDSVKSSGNPKVKIKDATKDLSKNQILNYTLQAKNLKTIDSLTTIYSIKADSVIGLASSLNIPIGWDLNSAPASWFNPNVKKKIKIGHKSGIIGYTLARNQNPDLWTVLKYIIGIVLSAVSLSFGAPFWFNLLVQFVNIRRAGKRPEATSKNQ